MISEKVLGKILTCAATDKSAEAKDYVRYLARRGETFADFRKTIADAITGEAMDMLDSAFPWLASDEFMIVTKAPAIIEKLTAAGRDGLSRSVLRAAVGQPANFDGLISDLTDAGTIVGYEIPAKTRPVMRYWLAERCPHGYVNGEFVLWCNIWA